MVIKIYCVAVLATIYIGKKYLPLTGSSLTSRVTVEHGGPRDPRPWRKAVGKPEKEKKNLKLNE